MRMRNKKTKAKRKEKENRLDGCGCITTEEIERKLNEM